MKSFSWDHGVFLGATIASEQTAAAEGPIGKLRRDPFAMVPFCGYNMADYFAHWLSFADRLDADKLPAIFQVNWFRKDENGKFLWPGFAENIRVIQWIVGQLEGQDNGEETALGILPKRENLNIEGLDTTIEQLEQLLDVDGDSWRAELKDMETFFAGFGDKLPNKLKQELSQLSARLN
jgi:phosphoenolpyruvate carboxykinase (GTP)